MYRQKECNVIEQQIADHLFKNHNMLLKGDAVDDVLVGLDISEARYNGSGYSYRHFAAKRKLTIKVGWYCEGRNVTFRQKTDGSFSIDKIVKKLVAMRKEKIASDVYRTQRETDRSAGGRKAKAVRKTFGLNEYNTVVAEQNYGRNLIVKLGGLTQTQAEKILQAAINAGVKL